jgi:hypothetical protein
MGASIFCSYDPVMHPLLEPPLGKVNPDAKESRPHRGIGPSVLDTESRLVVRGVTVVST